MGKTATVIIVEDESETRERLRRVVSKSELFECVACCPDVASAKHALSDSNPDICLLDIDLPDGSGLELIAWLQDEKINTTPVVVTVFEDRRHVMDAIMSGAAGYVLKDDPSISVQQALQVILSGGAPISPAIARQILTQFKYNSEADQPTANERNEECVEMLTPREREILIMLSEGYTDQEIAQQENISYYTVTTHVKHIYKKLSVKSRVEATSRAIRSGIV